MVRGASRRNGTRISLPPYFDHYGLYAFGRQPEEVTSRGPGAVGGMPVASHARNAALRPGSPAGAGGSSRSSSQQAPRRLGVAAGKNDSELAAALIKALSTRAQPIDRIFFDRRGGRDPGVQAYPREEFRKLAMLLNDRRHPLSHPYWSDPAPCSMYIDEVEVDPRPRSPSATIGAALRGQQHSRRRAARARQWNKMHRQLDEPARVVERATTWLTGCR